MASATRAMEYAHTIWGGRFCPIIPIDNLDYAEQLVDAFDVDALFAMTEDAQMGKFLARFEHLCWPFFHKDFWTEQGSGKSPQLLSVGHPLRHIAMRRGRDVLFRGPAMLYKWDKTDPLAGWLLATVGAYPGLEEKLLPDYEVLYRDVLNATVIELDASSKLPSNLLRLVTPNVITEFDLYLKRSMGFGRGGGIYVAHGSDFVDLVNYWNLRAGGDDLSFYSIAADARLESLKEGYLKKLEKSTSGSETEQIEMAIWGRDRSLIESLGLKNCQHCELPPGEWRFAKHGRPHFESSRRRSVLAAINDDSSPPTVSLPLPDKPYFDDVQLHHQHVVASVSSYYRHFLKDSDFLFPPPPAKSLNEFFARQMWLDPFGVRVDEDGVGFVVDATEELLQIRALETLEVFQKMFDLAGIGIERSQPGLIAHRLMKQMGGPQGCRVFKIPGIRDLIQKYKPTESFVYSDAIQTIRSHGFAEHESLYIDARKHKKLKPEDALEFLLKKGVFRAGLEFHCPNCELPFWKHIDECRTMLPCDYCGNVFNITPQLRHRGDWRFRRSGLFGKEDNQSGSIPVVLTLQQIDTSIAHLALTFCTSVLLKPITAAINECETDFIVSSTSPQGDVEIAISECKTNDEISERDVVNLSKVATCLSNHNFHAFLIFSKTGTFSPEEIDRCRRAGPWSNGGFILLSGRELEPYHIYERAEKEFVMKHHGYSFHDMVRATHEIYFDPVRR
jgi:hypothetical protein